MSDDKIYVELFTTLIRHVDSKNQNNNFSQAVIQSLENSSDPGQNEVSNKLLQLHDDIKRTKHFLQHIDKTDWIEGLRYYENISNPILKMELVSDFKEMKIADRSNDIVEYGRRLMMQLENCLNTVIQVIDGYEEILNDTTKYQDGYNDLRSGYYSFFKDNGNRKDLKDISIPSKLFFSKKYYGFSYDYKVSNELNKLRNIASHRGSLPHQDSLLMEDLKKNVTLKKAEYFWFADKVIKRLQHLFDAPPLHT